jgi:hypothetical protein
MPVAPFDGLLCGHTDRGRRKVLHRRCLADSQPGSKRQAPPPPHRPQQPTPPPACRWRRLIPPITPEKVKRRFHTLCLELLPDQGGSEKEFIALKAAYDESLQLTGGKP